MERVLERVFRAYLLLLRIVAVVVSNTEVFVIVTKLLQKIYLIAPHPEVQI